MAMQFDITFKHLIEAHPADWAMLAEVHGEPVEVIDADLATVMAEADKVLRVAAAESWLVELEAQSTYDAKLPGRVFRYNALLDGRHGLPVDSVVLLLRPEADGPAMTGRLERELPRRRRYLVFDYTVIRAWELSVETVLKGGIGTLPLAPLARVVPGDLPAVIRAMDERIAAEAPAEAATLWTAAYVLMGLRYPEETAKALLKGVRGMRESATYQGILAEGRAEGRAEGARHILLRFLERRFGPLPPESRAQVENLDADGCERLWERAEQVETLEELGIAR